MVHRIRKRQLPRLCLLPIVAILALCPSLAASQIDAAASPAEKDTSVAAKKLMGEGNALYAKRDFEGAHKKFLEAWAVKQHIAIASNLVETEMKLGWYVMAAARLRSLLSSMATDDNEERTAFMSQLSECRQHLLSLRITVNEDNATVRVNDKLIGKSPLDNEVLVEPGQSRVTAELSGYQSAKAEVEAGAAGETKTLYLKLVKKLEPRSIQAPMAVVHTTAPPREPERRGNGTKAVVLIGGSALAAAGVGFGLAYWAMRSSNETDIRRMRVGIGRDGCNPGEEISVTQCAELRSAVESYDRHSAVMAATFIGGGVAAVATLVTVLVWPSSKSVDHHSPPVKATFQPWSSVNAAGVNVIGQF